MEIGSDLGEKVAVVGLKGRVEETSGHTGKGMGIRAGAAVSVRPMAARLPSQHGVQLAPGKFRTA
jgi:hypothetical protein